RTRRRRRRLLRPSTKRDRRGRRREDDGRLVRVRWGAVSVRVNLKRPAQSEPRLEREPRRALRRAHAIHHDEGPDAEVDVDKREPRGFNPGRRTEREPRGKGKAADHGAIQSARERRKHTEMKTIGEVTYKIPTSPEDRVPSESAL